MEDAETETLIPTASKEHSSSSVDLKKKRKLQCGSGISDVPSPKQRHRINANIYEKLNFRETQNNLEQPEEKSENDSNSFTGACENSMAIDVQVEDENSITLTILPEQPSTSLNNYYNEVNNITSFYSLESRGIQEVSDATTSNLEETLQFDPGYKIVEKYSSFGVDHAILELESEGDAETESLIVEPHSFFRTSGCWNLGQDAPSGKKKPTIDQEFEQYFSSLML